MSPFGLARHNSNKVGRVESERKSNGIPNYFPFQIHLHIFLLNNCEICSLLNIFCVNGEIAGTLLEN